MEDNSKYRLLTVNQVAQIMNLSKSAIYAYAHGGHLKPVILPLTGISKAVKRNKYSLRFTQADIDKFYERICA